MPRLSGQVSVVIYVLGPLTWQNILKPEKHKSAGPCHLVSCFFFLCLNCDLWCFNCDCWWKAIQSIKRSCASDIKTPNHPQKSRSPQLFPSCIRRANVSRAISEMKSIGILALPGALLYFCNNCQDIQNTVMPTMCHESISVSLANLQLVTVPNAPWDAGSEKMPIHIVAIGHLATLRCRNFPTEHQCCVCGDHALPKSVGEIST